MRVRSLIGLVLLPAIAALTGCGDGGGGAAAPAATTTVISGMASKGPIKTGTVKVYAVRSGAEDRTAPIGQAQTDDGGNYTIDVGSYKGPVVVEITGGSYTDEVSGAQVTLKAPLRAVFANASTGKKTVAVTPLTELAYKKAKGAGPALTAASIDDANASIAAMFKLTDIVSTLPVAGGASDDQKKYAAACGSIAQLVNDSKGAGESLDDALKRVMTELGDEAEQKGGLSFDTINKINDAITRFSNSGKNRTGGTIAPISSPPGGLLKISSSGPASTIGAVDVTVSFPVGVKVNADAATGEVAAGVITISGVAAVGDGKLTAAKFTPAAGGAPPQLHVLLINSAGFGVGEFVTIRFDTDGGGFPAGTSAFSMAGFAAKGLDGSQLSGITAAPASVSAEF